MPGITRLPGSVVFAFSGRPGTAAGAASTAARSCSAFAAAWRAWRTPALSARGNRDPPVGALARPGGGLRLGAALVTGDPGRGLLLQPRRVSAVALSPPLQPGGLLLTRRVRVLLPGSRLRRQPGPGLLPSHQPARVRASVPGPPPRAGPSSSPPNRASSAASSARACATHPLTSAAISFSSSAIWVSSCSAVAFAAIDALAFTFVPSPATTSTATRPPRAHATSDATSSPFTASSWRVTNRAIVE